MLVRSAPSPQWYRPSRHCPRPQDRAKRTPEEEGILNKKRPKEIQKKYDKKEKMPESAVSSRSGPSGQLLRIASGPGQSGRTGGRVREQGAAVPAEENQGPKANAFSSLLS